MRLHLDAACSGTAGDSRRRQEPAVTAVDHLLDVRSKALPGLLHFMEESREAGVADVEVTEWRDRLRPVESRLGVEAAQGAIQVCARHPLVEAPYDFDRVTGAHRRSIPRPL